MHRTLRFAAVALLLLVLGTVPAHARPRAVHSSPAGFFGALWQWISPFLPPWTKEGGTMDPDGRLHGLLAPPPSTEAGGEMDPDG